jgi:CheY-like chemotaxis protein
VIALTAHAIKGDAEKYIDAGCNDYIPKPIDKKIFRKKISDLIEKKKPRA